MTQARIEKANVLGVGVSAIDMGLALEAIDRRIGARKKGYICVTGVHGVMEAQSDPDLRATLNQAFLNTPDGEPMVWVGRAQGHKGMSRVYGPDLMLEVFRLGVDRGYRHFFYGGNTGVAQALEEGLQARFPGTEIVGTHTPPFRPLNESEESEIVDAVRIARPDIIWVGLSTPKRS